MDSTSKADGLGERLFQRPTGPRPVGRQLDLARWLALARLRARPRGGGEITTKSAGNRFFAGEKGRGDGENREE